MKRLTNAKKQECGDLETLHLLLSLEHYIRKKMFPPTYYVHIQLICSNNLHSLPKLVRRIMFLYHSVRGGQGG